MARTHNELIVEAAYDVLRGDAPEPRNDKGELIAGMCLAQVRLIIERALYGGRWAWYDQHRTIRVDQMARASQEPYARDMEASLRDQGMALTVPRTGPAGDPVRYVDLAHPETLAALVPGDLLFRWDTVKDRNGVWVGHVAILLPGRLVLENVASRPKALSRGYTYLSKLGSWPVTTVARFTPREGVIT